LITGCDYGIGFEFAQQYANDGWIVHATCFKIESREKLVLLGKNVNFHHLDVSNLAAVKSFAAGLQGIAIDLFINNAATFAPDGDGQLMLPDMDEFMRVMRVNAVAPIYIAEALVDQVAISERKLMVFISTRSGSIGDNSTGGH